jgi:hypothetical protein
MSTSKFGILTKILRSRTFLIVFAILAATFTPLSGLSILENQNQTFVEMSTLGSNMTASDYFPNNNSTITVGQEIGWYVRVHNQLGAAEYLSIRVKLTNATEIMQNSTLHESIVAPLLFEDHQLVAQNGTWIVPLSWTITAVDVEESYLNIDSILMNGNSTTDLKLGTNLDGRFRIVVELWKYNPSTGGFEFAWTSENQTKSVWNHIWFNVKN